MFPAMRFLAIAIAVSINAVSTQFAAFACAQGANTNSVHTANPMGELLPWVFSPQMQRELEILEGQRQELGKLQAKTVEETRDLYAAAHAEDREQWMRKYQETASRLAKETDKRVQEILLPHQLRRLRQVVLQTQLHGAGMGSAAGFTSGVLADELQLTEAQKRELKEKEKEITAEVQRKTRAFYEQLREESEEELLSVLTEAQRRKLREMLGEKFDWQQPAKPARTESKGDAKDDAKRDEARDGGGKAAKP